MHMVSTQFQLSIVHEGPQGQIGVKQATLGGGFHHAGLSIIVV